MKPTDTELAEANRKRRPSLTHVTHGAAVAYARGKRDGESDPTPCDLLPQDLHFTDETVAAYKRGYADGQLARLEARQAVRA